ncbi:MAG: sn-glycerol-3-phosphate ABC transporter ATP-binding protein UgpC [Alphaproteobacteria bacterium]|nr:sn-glycerol-3-phosphate ABC transporter ATP-binding protein UgpC [Alphaproteobacteria bacterium]
MSTVQLRNVKKAFGSTEILHGIDLDIEDGEFVVFVGPSGCGKSTLLRVVAGLEKITSGDLLIDGRRVNNESPAKRGIAMVFQSYALYPHMTVYKNMAFGLKFAGVDKKTADEKVQRAAKTLQLDQLLNRLPRELSGGQRQRVAIGRAIVRDPNVFLFDEPLSNLDAALRVQTRLEIAQLHQELETTIIYVTHDQVEAMTLADKIVVVNLGEVAQVGSPLELYHRPQNLFVAGFIGSPKMNFVKGKIAKVEEGHLSVDLPGGQTARVHVDPAGAAAGAEVTLGVRPEHMLESAEEAIKLEGVVDVVERLGEASYVYMHLEDGTPLTVRADGHSRARTGDRVTVSAETDAAHLFDAEGEAFRPLGNNPKYSAQLPTAA